MTLKTNEQIRRMFGLASRPAKEAGREPKEFLEDLAIDVSGGPVERLSCLTFGQANEIIRRLGGEPLNPPGSNGGPRRTVSYRRRAAGIVQIATAAQLRLLNDLAAGRGITDAGLKNLCSKMIKKPAPRTTLEANKIIEAIKAMNARDNRKISAKPLTEEEARQLAGVITTEDVVAAIKAKEVAA